MRQIERAEAEFQNWPILEPLEGGRERPVALNKPVCVAGDRVRVNLPLPADTVSRAHVLFVNDQDGVYLRDLASLNQVTVNDEPVRETVLDAGDKLKIGPYLFRCDGNFRHDGHDHSDVAPADLCLADDETRFHLGGRTTVIGSRENCDIRVSDDRVAPAHAVIFEREGGRYIRDLRSKTGTYVNDRRVGQIELTPGDFIRVGETNFRYEIAAAAPDDTALPEILSPVSASASSDTDLPPELQPHSEDWGIIPLVDDSQEAAVASAPRAATAQRPGSPTMEIDEEMIPVRLDEDDDGLELAHSGASHPGQIQSGSMAGERRIGPPHTEPDSDDFDLAPDPRRPGTKSRQQPPTRRQRPGQPKS